MMVLGGIRVLPSIVLLELLAYCVIDYFFIYWASTVI